MLSLIDLISWCPGAQETNMAKSHTVTYSGILTSQINPFSIWQTLSLGTATHDALCNARLPSKGVAPWYSCRKRWIDSLLELQSKSLELTFVRGFKTHQLLLERWASDVSSLASLMTHGSFFNRGIEALQMTTFNGNRWLAAEPVPRKRWGLPFLLDRVWWPVQQVPKRLRKNLEATIWWKHGGKTLFSLTNHWECDAIKFG